MKSSKTRKTVLVSLAIALALVTVLASTFAWFSARDEVLNRLATKDGLANVSIQETFVEPDDWKPGQTITKEVAVVDTGSAPALARITFEELLKVNLPPIGEEDPFNATMATAGKKPMLFDITPFSGSDWFKVTTTANAGKGGIKLAADYEDLNGVEVWAKYTPAGTSPSNGSLGSYSFAMWAPVDGTAFDGSPQAITYTRAWDSATKTLTLSDIEYLAYKPAVTATADWTVDKPAAANIGKSVAETKLNGSAAPATADTTGNYPNNIQLNYANVITSLTGTSADNGKWYYNELDGYFYYIGLVTPGTTTAAMLESLLLKSAADSDYYSNLVFDLTVLMEAIQHTQDAVLSWVPTTGATANTDLNTALNGFCES